MNIYADIKKVTQIPQTNENPLFVRRKEQNALKQNRKLKKYKPPQNADVSNYLFTIYMCIYVYILCNFAKGDTVITYSLIIANIIFHSCLITTMQETAAKCAILYPRTSAFMNMKLQRLLQK